MFYGSCLFHCCSLGLWYCSLPPHFWADIKETLIWPAFWSHQDHHSLLGRLCSAQDQRASLPDHQVNGVPGSHAMRQPSHPWFPWSLLPDSFCSIDPDRVIMVRWKWRALQMRKIWTERNFLASSFWPISCCFCYPCFCFNWSKK